MLTTTAMIKTRVSIFIDSEASNDEASFRSQLYVQHIHRLGQSRWITARNECPMRRWHILQSIGADIDPRLHTDVTHGV